MFWNGLGFKEWNCISKIIQTVKLKLNESDNQVSELNIMNGFYSSKFFLLIRAGVEFGITIMINNNNGIKISYQCHVLVH